MAVGPPTDSGANRGNCNILRSSDIFFSSYGCFLSFSCVFFTMSLSTIILSRWSHHGLLLHVHPVVLTMQENILIAKRLIDFSLSSSFRISPILNGSEFYRVNIIQWVNLNS